MISPNGPLVLIFDLDETLFCVQELFSTDRAVNLSKSALNSLSHKHTKGYIKEPEIESGKFADKLRAIDRKCFAEIFRKIEKIKKHYNSLDLESPISVKILTKGSYDKESVKNIFNKLYAKKQGELFSSLSIEFFNRMDLNALEQNKSHTKIKSSHTHSGIVRMEKANLMDQMFAESWNVQNPTLKKERIYLIDNDDTNTEGVKKLGFNAFLWPTTPKSNNGKGFTASKGEILNAINQLIIELAEPKTSE